MLLTLKNKKTTNLYLSPFLKWPKLKINKFSHFGGNLLDTFRLISPIDR